LPREEEVAVSIDFKQETGLEWDGQSLAGSALRIQVDVFEVQLGAAVLLQFRSGDSDVVRVLADGGVRAAGYAVDHVHAKLYATFAKLRADQKRIDLVIGTHCDEDHLRGLVPVINDSKIDIGEACDSRQLLLPARVVDAAQEIPHIATEEARGPRSR
jgi:glyoxylase-like metal-dependent hydrolase (beta-lactamase superfamily II)